MHKTAAQSYGESAQSSRTNLEIICTNLHKPDGFKALHTPPFLTGRGDVCRSFVLSFVRSFVHLSFVHCAEELCA